MHTLHYMYHPTHFLPLPGQEPHHRLPPSINDPDEVMTLLLNMPTAGGDTYFNNSNSATGVYGRQQVASPRTYDDGRRGIAPAFGFGKRGSSRDMGGGNVPNNDRESQSRKRRSEESQSWNALGADGWEETLSVSQFRQNEYGHHEEATRSKPYYEKIMAGLSMPQPPPTTAPGGVVGQDHGHSGAVGAESPYKEFPLTAKRQRMHHDTIVRC